MLNAIHSIIMYSRLVFFLVQVVFCIDVERFRAPTPHISAVEDLTDRRLLGDGRTT